ncbi:MAG: ABC transporter permease [Acidobacteria bacterium]|nr:ABC transporter permease [Acidobacteriota bacterium]
MRSLARAWSSLALRVVPREWRDTVAQDLEDEALRSGRSDWWIGCQAIAAGVRLRPVVNGDVMWTDLRYAVRSLVQARWFTVGAVLTFALGIGVNIAVFRVLDRMMFRPLPYANVQSLALIRNCADGERECPFSFPAPVAMEARLGHLRTVQDVAGAWGLVALRPDPDQPDNVIRLVGVSVNILSVLGVSPAIGRDVSPDEANLPDRFVWLSFEAWQAKYGSDRAVVGQSIPGQRTPARILGVLPKGFLPPAWAGFPPRWDGLIVDRTSWASPQTKGVVSGPVARLRPGATVDEARQELTAVATSLGVTGAGGSRVNIRVDPLASSLFGRYAPYMRLIAVASGLILIIGCVNLAALQLVRSRGSARQIAIRAALGSSRARIITTALLESGLIALTGLAVAYGVNALASSAILSVLPRVFSGNAATLTDSRVLVFATLAAVTSAFVVGVWPTWRASRVTLRDVLVEEASNRGRSQMRMGRVLLAAEAALGCVLVLGAALALRSLHRMSTESIGINPSDLYTVSLVPTQATTTPLEPAEQMALMQRNVRALRRVAGVISATGGELDVLSGGAPPRPMAKGLRAGGRYQVDADNFATYGTAIIAGRTFTASEARDRGGVVAVSASAASLIWPGRPITSVIGQIWATEGESPRTVVAVVEDVKGQYGEWNGQLPAVYVPSGAEQGRFFGTYAIRMSKGIAPSPAAVVTELAADGVSARAVITSATELLDPSLRDPRFRAQLFALLGITGVLLLIVGLYAVSSFEVETRRREMAIRMSLGAQAGSVQRMVVRQSVSPVLLGTAVGLAGSYAVVTVAQQFLYRVDPRDGGTYAVVAVSLLTTGLAAAWIPARRAARTDPAVVLRAD